MQIQHVSPPRPGGEYLGKARDGATRVALGAGFESLNVPQPYVGASLRSVNMPHPPA